jgi:ABC-type transport system involved in multi-copper enzyme maturation permease subunit
MFSILIKKEVIALVRNYRYLLYFYTTFILINTSVLLLSLEYGDKLADNSEMGTAFKQYTKNKEERGQVYPVAKDGINYSIKPNRLQVFCQGAERGHSQMIRVALNRNLPLIKNSSVNPPFYNFFPAFDFTTIVIFLLSLMVFVFSYDSISRERENRTLRLVLSFPIPRSYIILAKLASGYIGIILPLVVSFFSSILLANMVTGSGFRAGEIIIIGVIFTCAGLYLLIMYLLGMAASVYCRRSINSIALLILAWLVLIIVLHNITLLAGKTGKGKVYKAELKREQYDQYLVNRDVQWEKRANYFKEHGSLPAEKSKAFFIENLEDNTRSCKDIMGKYTNFLDKTNDRLRISTYFSPSLQFLALSTALAGTGIRDRIKLYQDVVSHQAKFLAYIKEGLKGPDENPKIAFTKFPEFQPAPPNVAQALVQNTGYLIIQVVLVLLCFVWVVYAFFRLREV